MKKLTGLLCAVALVVSASSAFAQSAPPGGMQKKNLELPVDKDSLEGTGVGGPPSAPGQPGIPGIPGDAEIIGQGVTTPTPPPPPDPPVETPPPEPPVETPPEFYGEPIPTENQTIYFVIDSSCSMGWDSRSYVDHEGNRRNGNRMARAKSELIRAISSLSKNFRFNALAYGCSIRPFRPSLVKATSANKQAGIGWTGGLNPSDGTMTGPATAHALRTAPDNKSVVLLTDGAPNCGASGTSGHKSVIRAANRQGAIITVFGIGASGTLRRFCQDVARENGGAYRDVP